MKTRLSFAKPRTTVSSSQKLYPSTTPYVSLIG